MKRVLRWLAVPLLLLVGWIQREREWRRVRREAGPRRDLDGDGWTG